MEEIVRGMQAGEMGMVAKALSGAVTAKVSIPDHFLTTVKQWMDSRQQSSRASAQMSAQMSKIETVAAPRAVQGPDAANFEQLHRQLEDAIRRNDTQAMSSILQQAAKFAAARGSSGGLTTPVDPFAPASPTVSGGTPSIFGGVTPVAPGLTPVAPGGMTPLARGFTPTGASGLATPMPAFGSVTPKLPVPIQPVKQQARAEPPTSPVPSLPRPVTKAEVGKPTEAESPQYSPAGEPDFFDASAFDNAPYSSKDEAQFDFGSLGATSKFEAFDTKPAYTPTVDEIADYLRKTMKDTATFRQICSHFKPQPVSEAVRRTVEGEPALFTITGDRVTLSRDPSNPEALPHFTRELTKMPFTRKQIDPEEACEHVWIAASLALQSRPSDVVKLLTHVQKNSLRKTQRVYKGLFPANMPLVIACLIDRIVMSERRVGGVPRFENAFGPHIYSLIFQKWMLGNVQGSQFLANLLLMWERLGYFETKHIEPCKKPLLLILAYAPLDGVVDSPHKEKGTGWYKVIQRTSDFTTPAPVNRPEKRQPANSEAGHVKRLRAED